MSRWSCLILVVLLQTGCTTWPDPKGVLQPDSAADLISAIQPGVSAPLNMDTFYYAGLPGQEWEMASVETERVLQPDGTVRWQSSMPMWRGK
jgi:hypothetical protein